MIQDAVISCSGRVFLRVKVTADASRPGFNGYDQWRKCVRISVSSHPRKGKANAELLNFLSEWLEIKKSQIHIVSGARERCKIIELSGVTRELVCDGLSRLGAE